ncbi:folate-binding protein [Sphingomonas sp.]|uniref:CAF17-like 4Fe-4S cluster assembly/insertion protein YgfZ n=1 Tax=Sphingomonas sp. TaxID=28214 RepID=UPI0031D2634E
MTDATPTTAPGPSHEPRSGTTLTDRHLIRVAGADVRTFLQGLLTQDVAGLAPGVPRWAGLLTPQGKALFDFILWADDDAVLIDAEASQAEALARRLAMYRLRRAITIEPVDGLAVHWSSDAQDRPDDPRLPELGKRWLAPAGEAATGWTAHRLSLGVTEGVSDLGSGETLWLECNADELNGVSFTKGCYVGQENTARMHHRSKVNRRLVVAPLAEPGDRTRAAYPELGWMVEHRRVEALGNAIRPDWLERALATAG